MSHFPVSRSMSLGQRVKSALWSPPPRGSEHAAPGFEPLRIIGDMMEPTYREGDWVFVDLSAPVFRGDALYALWAHDTIIVRRLQAIARLGRPRMIRVLCDNRFYGDEEIELARLTIVGQVSGMARAY